MKPSAAAPAAVAAKLNASQLALLNLTVLLLLLAFVPQGQLQRKRASINITHNLRITKMQCTNTPYKLSQLHLCRMEQLPNGTVALNISLDVRPVLNYLEITAKLFYKYTTYRPFMIDWSIELCQAYRMGGINPSSALVLKIIETTVPNIYYACPHGNRSYSVLWYFDPKFIPDKLPSGDYRLDIVFRDTSNTVLISMQMYAAMRKQGLIG